MKRDVLLIAILVLGIIALAGQENKKNQEVTIGIKDVYISMFHTPDGHVIQKAPLTRMIADHLNNGSGVETIRYNIVDGLRDFYMVEQYGNNTGKIGTVDQSDGFAIDLSVPKPDELIQIPEEIQSDAENVLFAVAVINGKLTKPSFKSSDKSIYWLRPCIASPVKNKDGELLIPFKNLEIALPVYFNKNCTLNGVVKAGNAAYQYRDVPVKQGWNLLAMKYPDGEQWKSIAKVTVIPMSSPLTWVYIPYWDF